VPEALRVSGDHPEWFGRPGRLGFMAPEQRRRLAKRDQALDLIA